MADNTITDRQDILHLPGDVIHGGRKPGSRSQKGKTFTIPKKAKESKSKSSKSSKSGKSSKSLFTTPKPSQDDSFSDSEKSLDQVSGISVLKKTPAKVHLSEESETEILSSKVTSKSAKGNVSAQKGSQVSRVSQRQIKKPNKFTPSAYEGEKKKKTKSAAQEALMRLISAKDPILRKLKKNQKSDSSDE